MKDRRCPDRVRRTPDLDEKWGARYVRIDGSKSNELDETTLDPAKLVRA